MTSPIPIPRADISKNWTDEELFLSLQGMMRGSPLPGNVLANVNPCQYLPSDLSGILTTGSTLTNHKGLVHLDLSQSQGTCAPKRVRAKSRDDDLPIQDLFENDYILSGDYLEWDDLVHPLSPSSGSHNSSCVSLSSNELFDSIALLQDLDDEVNQDLPEKDENLLKFNLSSSDKQKELVLHPATLAYDKISPVKGATTCATSPKVGCDGGGTSNFHNALASSTKPKVVLEGEKKVPASSSNHKVLLECQKKSLGYKVKGPKKKKKKYHRYMPI